MEDEKVSRRICFTEESAACPAFPHQVHGPGQGARAGERPGVHAPVVGAEAGTAGAKFPAPTGERKEGIKRKKW